MKRATRTSVVYCWAGLVGLSSACGGAAENAKPKAPGGNELPTVIEHEACDTGSSEAAKVDVNGDGKPEMVRVRSGGRDVCHMMDFNHDGIPDTFVYLDEQGRVRRRESDFDRDGKLDEVALFADGGLVRKDRATMLDGKLHTWDFYESGKLQRRLRDSDGDGKVDEWWTWPNPDKVECPIVMTDPDADGKPDEKSAVDPCAAPAPPPPPALTASEADAGAPPSTTQSSASGSAELSKGAADGGAAAVSPSAPGDAGTKAKVGKP